MKQVGRPCPKSGVCKGSSPTALHVQEWCKAAPVTTFKQWDFSLRSQWLARSWHSPSRGGEEFAALQYKLCAARCPSRAFPGASIYMTV